MSMAVGTAAKPVVTHTRRNSGVLADVEKRTLIWIAKRLPAWIHSDHLTALGLIGMVGVGAAFAVGGTYSWALPLVVIALAVNWFGDSLDGTLARVRNQQRPRYGYYVDHVLDVAGTACLFGGLVLGGHMSEAVAAMALAGYVAVMAEVFLATAVRGEFRMSFAGVGPTELRLLLAAGALALMGNPHVTIGGLGRFGMFDVGGVIATMGFAVAFLMAALRNGRALYREEPLPRRTPARPRVSLW